MDGTGSGIVLLVRAYRDLFADRRARWPLLTSSFSRLTTGMIALALVLLVRGEGYDYAAAGLVTAGHQLGVGVASPIQGKLADRWGQRTVLLPDAVLYAAGLVLLSWLATHGARVPLLVTVAVLSGVFYPPVTAGSRVLISHLFRGGQLRETGFAVSSIAVELGFIVGPLFAVAIEVRYGGAAAVWAAAAIAFVGAMTYASTAAVAEVPRRDPSTGRGGALRSPGVRVVVVAVGAIAVCFGVFDIVLPAVAEFAGDPQAAGPLIAAVGGGSLLGGLVYGGRRWPGTLVTRVRVLGLVMTVGMALVPLTTSSLPLFGVGLFVGGLFLAPTMISTFQLIDDLAPPGTHTEAQSWMQATVVAGVAAGASLSGAVVEAAGPELALLAGAGGVGLGALLLNVRRGRLEAGEAPATAPV